MSGDPKLGLLYLPVESADRRSLRGDRPGNNLVCYSFGGRGHQEWEAKVAHQITPYDIWGLDNPSAPVVADLPMGRKVVMQVTKQSWVFTFDRVTGEPIWPIEEKPVQKLMLPGEWTAPTHRFPTAGALRSSRFTEAG